MSNITCDLMWREAMMDLLDQLEAENPEDPALAPHELSEWAALYVRYLSIFRKLELSYDQMLQPQKRADIKAALEACMGRMLELRHWMVKLNRGLDLVQLDDLLVDLKLTPEVLEVPVPRCFIEDRAQELRDRNRFLEVLLTKANSGESGEVGASSVAPAVHSAGGRSGRLMGDGPALPLDEAVAIIIRNERGRQARARMRAVVVAKRAHSAAALAPPSREAAATRIQCAWRGHVMRRTLRQDAHEELVFVRMRPQLYDAKTDPQTADTRAQLARKHALLDPERGALRRYDDAIVSTKSKVKGMEGEDMREAIQDKINAWFLANRNPQTGEYPDLPSEADGGSKVILRPPMPSLAEVIAANAAAGGNSAAKAGGKGAKSGSSDAAAKKGGSSTAATGGGRGSKGTSAPAVPPGMVREVIPSAFVPAIEAAIAEFISKWQDRPAPRLGGGIDAAGAHDDELLRDELRPLVFEEVRLQVDEEMRVLLANLKALVAAEAAARAGRKPTKKDKDKGKGEKKKPKKADKAKGAKGTKTGGKRKKDPTSDRSMESLFAELAAAGVLRPLPHVELADYLGAPSFMGSTLERAGLKPDASMAQIRQMVTEYAILPLGSAAAHARVPHTRSMLLYGAHNTGKTLLAQAIAHMSGALLLDLSPRVTDGHYPGKAVSMLVHMVFKVARTMAPSVVYIDEVEKVFVSDKKRAREFGGTEPFSRIKRDLLREIKALTPGDRVLVLGCSSEPWLATKKDEKTLTGAWSKMLHLPLPDYASRRMLWSGLFARHGASLPFDFDSSTLTQLSEGYTPGDLNAVVAGLLSPARRERLPAVPVDVAEVLQWLCRVSPVASEVDEALHGWAEQTRAAATDGGADNAGAGSAGGSSSSSSTKKGGGIKTGDAAGKKPATKGIQKSKK